MSELLLVFEDEHLFVLEKPALLHSVANKHSDEHSLADLIINERPAQNDVAPRTEDAGLVQRLDFETSGLILGAKSRAVWEAMHALLGTDRVDKRYLAILEGGLQQDKVMDAPVGPRRKNARKVSVFTGRIPQGIKAQPAKTMFHPVRPIPESGLTLVEVSLFGGRRHQIRAHASAIGHPLWGDELYGSKRATTSSLPPFLLHAHLLSFPHPVTGERVSLRSEPRWGDLQIIT